MHRGELIEVKISEYAFGGRGIAKVPTDDGDFVIFIDNCFPGQTVQARITKKKKRYAEAKLVDVLQRQF